MKKRPEPEAPHKPHIPSLIYTEIDPPDTILGESGMMELLREVKQIRILLEQIAELSVIEDKPIRWTSTQFCHVCSTDVENFSGACKCNRM